MMSGIRGKDTSPEILIRKGLHANGFRFRLHSKGIPGKPDIVLPKYRALIVVHGCFWHGHHCRYFKWPSSNVAFWEQKINGNKERDERNLAAQIAGGWRVLTVWECAVRAGTKKGLSNDVVTRISEWLRGTSENTSIDESSIGRKNVF